MDLEKESLRSFQTRSSWSLLLCLSTVIGLIIYIAVVVQPPNAKTIDRLHSYIIVSMYTKTYNNVAIRYTLDDVIMLLNKTGMNDMIPESMRFDWGCALLSLSSAKQAVTDIRVSGGKMKQQNKQAVPSSMRCVG